jgi:hypothetical protein
LAYCHTLAAPQQITPAQGVFLEYAPINRRYDLPYAQQMGPTQPDGLHMLDANLEVFCRKTAQVLEYWLDVSRFSQWRRPTVQLPWNREVFGADVDTYGSRGIRHITMFAAWGDAEYVTGFGEPKFIEKYGAGLSSSKRK